MPGSGEQPEADDRHVVPFGLDLYRIALDEYRFQVNLNWERTQHWFALNAAIAGAGVALLQIATQGAYLLVSAVFFFGAATCGIGVYAFITQHRYYRSIRSHKARIEADLGLGDYAIRTTGGMGADRRSWVTMTKLHIALLIALALVDLGGASFGAYRYSETRSTVSALGSTPSSLFTRRSEVSPGYAPDAHAWHT